MKEVTNCPYCGTDRIELVGFNVLGYQTQTDGGPEGTLSKYLCSNVHYFELLDRKTQKEKKED